MMRYSSQIMSMKKKRYNKNVVNSMKERVKIEKTENFHKSMSIFLW